MFQTCNSSLKSPFGEWLINTTTTTTSLRDSLDTTMHFKKALITINLQSKLLHVVVLKSTITLRQDSFLSAKKIDAHSKYITTHIQVMSQVNCNAVV